MLHDLIFLLDTDNISFQRVKSGFFGWGSDKSELVSGMECKVTIVIHLILGQVC